MAELEIPSGTVVDRPASPHTPMGAMADDPAMAYDFSSDPRWAEYVDTLSLDTSDTTDDAVLLTMAKQNWYHRNVVCDLLFSSSHRVYVVTVVLACVSSPPTEMYIVVIPPDSRTK